MDNNCERFNLCFVNICFDKELPFCNNITCGYEDLNQSYSCVFFCLVLKKVVYLQ